MARGINLIGRALGLVCAAALASAWAYVLWVPASGLTLGNLNIVTALVFVVLAVFAGIAAVHGHATVIALIFLASFFPIGVSLLPREHWLQWVGWLDLGLLASALLIWLSKPRAATPV
jgi:L-cystine uptake protein TcyP (sodium:dicarboxylate symporter family)